MQIPEPTSTPVGAGALAAMVATVGLSLLGLWPPYSTLPSAITNAIAAFAVFVAAYLGSWNKVRKAGHQQVTLELTPSSLPTVQAATEDPL